MEKILKIAFIVIFSRQTINKKPPRLPVEFYIPYGVWIGLQPN